MRPRRKSLIVAGVLAGWGLTVVLALREAKPPAVPGGISKMIFGRAPDSERPPYDSWHYLAWREHQQVSISEGASSEAWRQRHCRGRPVRWIHVDRRRTLAWCRRQILLLSRARVGSWDDLEIDAHLELFGGFREGFKPVAAQALGADRLLIAWLGPAWSEVRVRLFDGALRPLAPMRSFDAGRPVSALFLGPRWGRFQIDAAAASGHHEDRLDPFRPTYTSLLVDGRGEPAPRRALWTARPAPLAAGLLGTALCWLAALLGLARPRRLVRALQSASARDRWWSGRGQRMGDRHVALIAGRETIVMHADALGRGGRGEPIRDQLLTVVGRLSPEVASSTPYRDEPKTLATRPRPCVFRGDPKLALVSAKAMVRGARTRAGVWIAMSSLPVLLVFLLT